MTRTFEQIGEVIVDGEPGHVDGTENSEPSVGTALSLEYMGVNPDTATVAQLHVTVGESPLPFEQRPDMGNLEAIAIEMTVDTLRDLATRANGLADLAEETRQQVVEDAAEVAEAALPADGPLYAAQIVEEGGEVTYLGPVTSKGQVIVAVLKWAQRHPAKGAVVTPIPLTAVPE